MKKNLLRLFGVFFAMFLSFSLFAQQYGSLLDESFENGIPENWTQEVVTEGLMWTTESGDLVFPNGAFDGDKRVAFRNVSGTTTNACTRLISPTLDISTLYRPLLVFSHAQDHWTKDVDVLRILYRLSPESEWVELEVFDECITFWQLDTIRLVGKSKTYQIAFEAKDNLGRGVVIDAVEVRSTPRCDTPYALMISELTSSSAVINWLGAFDAKGFDLKVSTEPLSIEQLNDKYYKADVKDTLLGKDWKYKLTNLVSGAKYYYYMRSICQQEISEWVADSFQVANLISIPYFNDFNLKQTNKDVSYPEKWICKSSGAIVPPFVNTCLRGNHWYSSVDSTFSLCFYGSDDVENVEPIRAGAYAYAVLPEVECEDIRELSVSFQTINYNPHLSDRFSIIVGVMTDPNEKNTFVSVDTINVNTLRINEEFVVSLENYEGEGKFITFMSDFIESNIFCIDNLSIQITPNIRKVNDFTINLVTSNSARIDFELDYSKYDVVFSTEKISSSNIDNISLDGVVRTTISNHGVIEGLVNNTNYYVYARAVEGNDKGEWSIGRIVRTPGKIEILPYTETFTIDRNASDTYYSISYGEYLSSPRQLIPNGIITLTSGAYSMYCDDSACSETTQSGGGNISFGGHTVEDDPEKHLHASLGLVDYDFWGVAVFPELVADINSVSVRFVAKNSHETYDGVVIAGVMSIANDISTFQPIDTIKLTRKDKIYIYNLDEYDVEGQFWAFLVDSKLVETDKNVVCIDDVRFSSIPSCKSPSDIELVSVEGDPTQMGLKWKTNGVKSWVVRLSEREYSLDSMYFEGASDYEYIYNDTVNTNSVLFTKLRPSGNIYYYTICPICGEDSGNWSDFESFATNCYDEEAIPYIEDFDNVNYRVGFDVKGFSVSCMLTKQLTNNTTIYTPSISDRYSFSGSNSLMLMKSTRLGNKSPYVALPKMSKPLKELQLSFKTFGQEIQPPILVGVMTDPYDTLTFETVDVIYPIVIEKESEDSPEEFLEYIVSFANYKGDGEHIALMLKDDFEYFGTSAYIDDIVVNNIVPCARPEKIKLMDYDDKMVELSWVSPTTINRWRVVFALDKLSLQELANPTINNVIVKIDTVTTNPSRFTDLESNSRYYVYVQSLCSDVEASEWSNYFVFNTLCVPLNINDTMVESFEGYETGVGSRPGCYIVGSNSKDRNYTPYCDTEYKHTGKASLHIKSTEEANGAYVITNELAVDDISEVKLSFWGYTKYPSDRYAHSLVVGVLTSPANLATFVPVDTITFSSEERPYEIHFNNYKYDYNGERGKFVMFLSEFENTNDVNIDDISFGPASQCPTSFYFDDITANSCRINFTSNNGPYEVKMAEFICPDTLLDSDVLTSYQVTDNTLLVENLSPYTSYYFYIRSTCDGVYGDWSSVNVVRTECLETLPLPYFDNFDNQDALDQCPDCWESFYREEEITYPSLKSSGGVFPYPPYSGDRKVYLYTNATTPSYLVTREIEVDDLSKCQVTFFMFPSKLNENNSVVVGVVSDIYNIAESFEPIDTVIINIDSWSWKECFASLKNYEGTAKHIAFMSSHALNESSASSSGVYIDDVLIELIPTCAKPRDYRFVNHTDSTLTLSFANSGVDRYEVAYGSVDFDVNLASNILQIEDTIFTLLNLESGSYYDVYVRSVCSEEDKSPWSYAGKYFTAAELITEYPYLIDFENESEKTKWMFKQDGQVNKWCIGTDTAYMVTDTVNNGGKALFISWDGGLSAHYDNTSESKSWSYRALQLDPGTYTISFDWTCVGETKKSVIVDYNDYMRAVLLPTSSIFEAGSNQIKASDNSYGRLITAKTVLPKGFIELSDKVDDYVYLLNGVDESLPLSEQWKTKTLTFVIDSVTAGAYNLVFYWVNNKGEGVYSEVRSAVVDNINIVREECDIPYNLQIDEIGESYATLTWDVVSKNVKGYNITVESVNVDLKASLEERIVFTEFVETNSIKITGLDDNTDYKAYVQVVCDTQLEGPLSEPFVFTTTCAVVAIDSVLNFDDEDNHIYIPYMGTSSKNTTYPTPKCFSIGHDTLSYLSSSYARYFPNLIGNTRTKQYSRSGDYALVFESKTSMNTSPGGYIVLPEFEGDRDNLLLSFWMRCIDNNPTTGKVGPGSAALADKYSRKLSVGTIVDPNDLKTFELITTVDYIYDSNDIKSTTEVSQDPTGNEYWMECVIPLAGTEGKYIALKNGAFENGLINNLVYVDDIKLVSATCIKPEYIKFDSIATESAIVSCTSSPVGKHIVKIATNDEFTENLRIDTVYGFPYELSSLEPSTLYYLQIQSLCYSDKNSEWSDIAVFTTQKVLPYTEDFNVNIASPLDWKRANSPAIADVCKGTPLYFTSPNIVEGWLKDEAMFRNGLFSSSHMAVNISCLGGDERNASKHWLVSPSIVLPNKEDLHLVFDLALTDMDTSDPIGQDDLGSDPSKFIVVISDDEGKTWKQENSVVWGTDKDDYKYFDIPNTGKKYSIDLDEFAGKIVQIAFYVESAVNLNTTTTIHIDNVHVNTYSEKSVEVSLCETEDYLSGDLFVPYSELQVGKNYYDDWVLSNEKDKDDILNVTCINVLSMVENRLTGMVCEGSVYDLNNFDNLMQAGVYKQKLSSANHCDSVVILDLSVIPSQRIVIADTICSGQKFEWNGNVYDKSGAYIDTLISVTTGCDSIVTLALRVNDALRVNEKVNICYGDSYQFGSQTINTSGRYVESFVSSEGCDSIVTLEATVLPEYYQTISAVIRKGEKYEDNGFHGISREGTYTLSLKSVDDCDSTIVLDLVVLEADTTYVNRKITTEDLPYEYQDLYYDENTLPGTYVDTIVVVIDDVEYVIIHTLVVDLVDAVDNVKVQNLVLIPNPLKSNQALYIVNDFTIEERHNLIVEIFDMMGQKVCAQRPTNYPIVIEQLSQSGVYVVRIITGVGSVYQGKIVIE